MRRKKTALKKKVEDENVMNKVDAKKDYIS